jgi:hypothetical protein
VSFHPATQSRNGNTQAYWFQQSACLLLIGLVQVTWPPLTQSPWTQDVPFCLTSFGHCRAYFGMLGWVRRGLSPHSVCSAPQSGIIMTGCVTLGKCPALSGSVSPSL